MKKLMILVGALAVLTMAATGFSKKTDEAADGETVTVEEENTQDAKEQLVNPMKSYDDLKDAEKACGLMLPEINLKGYEAECFYTLCENDKENAILGVEGSYNGMKTEIRMGYGKADISGINGGETLEDGMDGVAVSYRKYEETVYAEWSVKVDDKEFSYSVSIEKGSTDDLNEFVSEIGVEEVTAE